MFIGTYTDPSNSQGIYSAKFNSETGEISDLSLAAVAENPSFVALHPTGDFLYAVHETYIGAASSYKVQADGHLKYLNTISGLGNAAAHLSVDLPGLNLFTVSYNGATLNSMPISTNGSLAEPTFTFKNSGQGPDPVRQGEPHMHSVYSSVDGKSVYACDLGTDEVLHFDLDSQANHLKLHDPRSALSAAGGGARHLAQTLSGQFAYVNNEMLSSVTQFSVTTEGVMTRMNTYSTIPSGTIGNSTAEIILHPNQKWLYVSNRGHNSIAVFQVSSTSGDL